MGDGGLPDLSLQVRKDIFRTITFQNTSHWILKSKLQDVKIVPNKNSLEAVIKVHSSKVEAIDMMQIY